ncbi:class I SAM-dependent methyltransferase [Sphingopyxis panaciterrae]
MDRKISYDSQNDRLVFRMSAPDQEYWEQLWNPMMSRAAIMRGNSFVTAETKRVLPQGARVLDAGCGVGATVCGLANAGYDAMGIDFAEETVATIRSLVPELQIQVADVRALPFEDGSLDGIWSLGVIEHFYDGFAPLIEETHRALRPGGYLFLTVPIISPLKALKIRKGAYPPPRPEDRDQFFQFAFRPDFVAKRISEHGFSLLRSYGRSGGMGITEDAPKLARAFMLRKNARSLPARLWWRLADKLVTPFSQHTRFFLFQKT